LSTGIVRGNKAPSGVGDFPVLHFLPVFGFISHFYQLFLVSCLFVNTRNSNQLRIKRVNKNSGGFFAPSTRQKPSTHPSLKKKTTPG
jgi:hypothetical protein